MKILVVVTAVVLLLITGVDVSHALSSSTSPLKKQQQPVRKVAIIGAGIAGLSTAHALLSNQKDAAAQENDETNDASSFQISIFDARPELDTTAGAGIQLNGGLAVLGKISPLLQQAVLDAGLDQTMVRSRCKPWGLFDDDNSSSNNEEKYDTLLSLPLKETVQQAGPHVQESLIQNDRLLWTSIMRGALQEALFVTLVGSSKAAANQKPMVQFGKLLTEIIQSKDDDNGEQDIFCCFADGSQAGPFDLIVGCDGVKSAVKEYIDRGEISRDPSSREGAAAGVYSGLRIRYAVRDGNIKEMQQQPKQAVLTQYFGDGGYSLAASYGSGKSRPNTQCAFITYLDQDYIGPFRKRRNNNSQQEVRENADWSQDVRNSVEKARETMLQQVRDCGIPEEELVPTISNADRFFEVGVYVHNPFCSWSKEISNEVHAVLCGDAAHALPPFLGQGSNQAIQDAYCLATRIKEYNRKVASQEQGDLGALLKDYEATRWPATFQIFWKAAFLGYLETGGSNGLYSKFRDVFFKSMGIIGVAKRVLLGAAVPKV